MLVINSPVHHPRGVLGKPAIFQLCRHMLLLLIDIDRLGATCFQNGARPNNQEIFEQSRLNIELRSHASCPVLSSSDLRSTPHKVDPNR